MQTLEARATVKSVLKAHSKTKLGSITALPASPEALQKKRGGTRLAHFVGQGHIRRAMVPKPGAHNVMLGNIKTRQGRVDVLAAILASSA